MVADASLGWPDWIPGVGDRVIRSLTDSGQDGWRGRGSNRIPTVYHFDGKAWVADPTRTHPDAWIDRILPSRLSPWTKDGEIFGLPQDVHPVTITYRADLFAQAGVDLAAATTWSAFQEACLRFEGILGLSTAIRIATPSSCRMPRAMIWEMLSVANGTSISSMPMASPG